MTSPRTLAAMICNYNQGSYLPKALDALLSQTRLPDEILLMDDASTDDSWEVMQRYAARHSIIKAYRHEQNRGAARGADALTALARSDFVHWGAADDHMLPTFVEDALGAAETVPDPGVSCTQLEITGERTGGTYVKPLWNLAQGYTPPERYRDEYLVTHHPGGTLAPSSIYKRSAVLELGGWHPELDVWGVSFVLHAAALKYGICYVERPGYVWLEREDTWTTRSDGDAARNLRTAQAYYSLLRSPQYAALFGDVYPKRWMLMVGAVRIAQSTGATRVEFHE